MRFFLAAALLVLTSCAVMTYLPARMGAKYYEEGDYAKAIQSYMKAIADRDQRAETFYWLGMSFYRHGDLEEAMLALERSVEKDSTDVVVMERLAAVHLDLGNFRQAASYCRKAILRYAGYLEAYNTMGHIFFNIGELDSAAYCFRYVLTTAQSLRLEAIANSSFVSYNEEKAEANNGLGEICIARGLLPQALDYFNAAISLAHNWETPWFNKGRAYEALGNTKAAEVAYRRTIDLAPRTTWAYKNLARMYRRLSRDDEATRLFSRAIAADSTDVECYYGLAEVHEQKGDIWTAALVYGRAVDAAPNDLQAYSRAGRANMLIGKYDLAIEYLITVADLQPEKAEAHNALGEAYRAARDTLLAQQEFETAIARDSLFTLPLRNLGTLLLEQGRDTEGLKHLLRAARLGDGRAAAILRSRSIQWE